MPSFFHITPSDGLYTHHFVEAIQQASFNLPNASADGAIMGSWDFSAVKVLWAF
jgi:hypothetical protein